VVKILEAAFIKSAQDKDFLALAEKAKVKITARDAKQFFAVSKSIYDEIKAEEGNLSAMVKPEK